MTDEILEQHLRKLPMPTLPGTWREEIVSQALRKARSSSQKNRVWPPLLLALRNLFARNPITTSALAALWLLIFFFKTTTPVDPEETKLIAHLDPNHPIRFDSFREQILLAEYLQDQEREQDQEQRPLIP
jgi:hypothetical protein